MATVVDTDMSPRLSRAARALALVLSLFLISSSIHAANTWIVTGANSNWIDSTANWSSNHIPLAGEDVVISNATVQLTNDTPILKSLLITNSAKLYIYSPITNGSTAWGLLVTVTGDLSIAGSSWIYPYSHNTNGGSASFSCSNLTVGTTSGFDANSKGYRGGDALTYNSPGCGPGGSSGNANGSGGAGYGGVGGKGNDGGAAGGSTYGSYTNPADPGSGSRGVQWAVGYPGGGLVRVEAADSVVMDGSMLANGANGASYMGAGSGGGIYVKCRTFKGSGSLSAAGGNGMRGDWRDGGGGAGGRIAVVFDAAAQAGLGSQPTVTFNAAGGSKGVSDPSLWRLRGAQGRPGSLYFTTNTFFDLSRIQGGTIMVPGATSWSAGTLSLTNGLIEFPTGFSLTVSQDMNLTGGGGIDLSNSVVSISGDLIMNSDQRANASFRGGPGQQLSIGTNFELRRGWVEISQQGTPNPSLAIPGNLTMSNASLYFSAHPTALTVLSIGGVISGTQTSLVYLYSGMTNGLTNYSLLVDVAAAMTIASNSWVYPYSHYTNGGSVHFRAANLTVNAGGGIDASAKGYAGQFLTTYSLGLGPSLAPAGNSQCTPGAGYGGQGGGSTANSIGGQIYGSSNAPVSPGSGGGSSQNLSSGRGSYGGGLIFVEAASTVLVDGSLLANGESRNAYGGAGSGGAIYISCRVLKGAAGGLLSANGGTNMGGQAAAGSGGGGGGRIAVWSLKPTTDWLGVAQVNGGPGRYAGQPYDGTNGTIFWGRLRDAGTVFVVH